MNYFEHGSFLTANHGHAATMGVFGMLAIGLGLWCMRNLVRESAWRGRLFTLSFWGLNAGLMGMVVVTLTPVGLLQLGEAMESGYHAARSIEFYDRPVVQALLWARIVPDAVFLGLGVVPLVAGALLAVRSARPALPEPAPVRGRRRGPERLVPEPAVVASAEVRARS